MDNLGKINLELKAKNLETNPSINNHENLVRRTKALIIDTAFLQELLL